MAFADNPKLVNSGADFNEVIVHGLNGTGTSAFLAGELVYSNAGVATVVADDGVVILGQALVSDGASAAEVQVQAVLPTQIWKIKLYSTSGGAVSTANNFTVGKAYGFERVGNIHYVNLDEVTADAVVYCGPALTPGQATTACNWGLFRFLPTVCQLQTGN